MLATTTTKNNPIDEINLKFDEGIPGLLKELNCSLLISNYSTNQVICLESILDGSLMLSVSNLAATYGLTYRNNRLASATFTSVIIFEERLHDPPIKDRPGYLKNPRFTPEITYDLAISNGIRDLCFDDNNTLWVINSAHSCLCTIPTDDSSYLQEEWAPYFISDTSRIEDRCHLNGLAFEDGHPKYVTALGKSDEQGGWRKNIITGGILMDVDNNEIILEGLAIPHTPRIINGQLFMLLSGKGQLIQVDPNKGKYEVVLQLQGFARGMARRGDYLFLGASCAKKDSSSFGKLQIPEIYEESSITIFHLPTGKVYGKIIFDERVRDIYDIVVFPNKKSPRLITPPKLNPSAQPLIFKGKGF